MIMAFARGRYNPWNDPVLAKYAGLDRKEIISASVRSEELYEISYEFENGYALTVQLDRRTLRMLAPFKATILDMNKTPRNKVLDHSPEKTLSVQKLNTLIKTVRELKSLYDPEFHPSEEDRRMYPFKETKGMLISELLGEAYRRKG